MWYEKVLQSGLLPDWIIRIGIRYMIRQSIRNEIQEVSERQQYLMEIIEELKKQPIAIHTNQPNVQHYELPAEFFKHILGDYLKYSCCLWRNPNKSIKKEVNLNQAEKDMLALTCERAQMKDGLKVLDLGCGWGSLTIYLAQNYPKATITAVSNSAIQIAFIDKKVKKLGLRNVKTIKADVKNFTITEQFDRIISIEMFEHMRNYQKLFQKIQQFLKDNGKLFIHIFTHKNQPYLFEKDDETDFMAKYFFTGGTLPTADILFYFAENFTIEHHWRINGKHYEKTLNSWLWKMKKKKQQLLPIIEDVYGSKNKRKWWVYWKVFFIANAAIFGWKKGNHWFVSHYLFKKKE